MEESNRHGKRTTAPSMEVGARKAALAFLDARDDGRAEDGAMFARSANASRASAESVMGRIRAIGSPDGTVAGDPQAFRGSGKRSRSLRIAALATAAALIAGISSLLTIGLLRSSGSVDVRFVLAAPEASSVMLAADFNQWSPDGYDLVKGDDGNWEIIVPLRKGRAYTYNFIIDGERWIADPAASSILEDGFGGSSSSLSL